MTETSASGLTPSRPPAPELPSRGLHHAWWLPALLLILLAIGLVLGLLLGGRANTFAEAWQRIPDALSMAFFPDSATEAQTGDDLTTVMAVLRTPRTILALLVGLALGAAGAVIQGHTRNPLADPGILGVNAGAAAAITLSLSLGLITDVSGYVWPSLMGGGIVSALVFMLSSSRTAAIQPLSIVLAGAALSALLMAYVGAMVLSDNHLLNQLRQWATGSVDGRDLQTAGIILPLVVIGLLLALFQTRALNLLALGEQMAHSLGIPVIFHRTLGIVIVAMLGGAATAAAGPVNFIGLAAPHLVRAITGPDHRFVVPYSALFGAALALLADILGRVIARPGELQMGVMMALIGVPFLINLVRRGKVGSL